MVDIYFAACSLHLSGRMKRKIISYKKPSKETRDSDVVRQDESERMRVRERDTESAA